MSQLLLKGGGPLEGELPIQGAKNSVLPILAATLLTKERVVLQGCPRLRDVDASMRILKALGCEVWWEEDALVVETGGLNQYEISDTLMREMRSSAIFLGAILARCGQAELSYPGGYDVLWGHGNDMAHKDAKATSKLHTEQRALCPGWIGCSDCLRGGT